MLLSLLVAVSACSASPRRTSQRWLPGDMDGLFIWPTAGSVSSEFGPRGRAHHDGIDIAAPEGTPVRAAAEGVVVYSGTLRGYGQVVIMEHRYGLVTVYAHNLQNLVEQGARVRRGTVIASVGKTGRTTGPNLHFEVRRDNIARNPFHYLPRRGEPAVIAKQEPVPFGG